MDRQLPARVRREVRRPGGTADRRGGFALSNIRYSRADFPPIAVEGHFPGARRDIAGALKRFAVRIGVAPASVVTGVTVGPIDPALNGWFERHSRTILVDCTHPHRGEIAAHELGHALDAALLRAIAGNAGRAYPPDLPRIGIKPEFDVPRKFASTDAAGMRDYESNAVKEQLRRLQSLANSYAVHFVFERWAQGLDVDPGRMLRGAAVESINPIPSEDVNAEYSAYIRTPSEGFAELVRRYLYPRIRHGRKALPCRFEAEHLDEFRRVMLPFIRAEFRKVRLASGECGAEFALYRADCTSPPASDAIKNPINSDWPLAYDDTLELPQVDIAAAAAEALHSQGGSPRLSPLYCEASD